MKIMLNKTSANRIKLVTFLVVILLSLVYIFVNVLFRFRPVFLEKASHTAKTRAVDIINKATDSVFSDISSPQMVIIDKDNEGNVISVKADTILINRLKTKLSNSIQRYAEDSTDSKVYIPVGSLTDFEVLQGVGYRIPINVATDSITKIDFKDEFVSAGINQVKYKIYMIVSVRVSVISATMTKSETVESHVPVAEVVLSGTVPNYYGDNMSILGR